MILIKCTILKTEDVCQEIDRCDFTAFTKNAITSKTRLMRELKKIRQDGYAQDNREVVDEIVCYAAPIFNHHKDIIAAMSIAGPFRRMTDANLKGELIREIKSVAHLISDRMGYTEDAGWRLQLNERIGCGPELKFAGYDMIIVRGRASKPIMLVELQDFLSC